MGAFAELKAAGKVREIGCSNHTPSQLAEARRVSRTHGWPVYQALQQRHSILRPKDDAEFGPQRLVTDPIRKYLRNNDDLSLIAYGVLRVGVGMPLTPEYDTPANRRRLATVADIAARYGRSATEVALAWIMTTHPSAIPLVSTRNVGRLRENLGALTLQLDEEAMASLDALTDD